MASFAPDTILARRAALTFPAAAEVGGDAPVHVVERPIRGPDGPRRILQ
ncbi:hypothetical protein [Nocardia panacis]|nr:hypothetical protein [Nocardia panacis]